MKRIALVLLLLGMVWSCRQDDGVDPGVQISSINPQMGKPGDEVTIKGSGFDATISNNLVRFNGTQATVKTASSTQLVVEVPENVTTGELTVTVGNRPQASGGTFTFENLAANLSYGSTQGSASEGEQIITDITLSQVLSKELTLKGALQLSTAVNGAKSGDFNNSLEYSVDGGSNWKTETDGLSIIVPAGTSAFKVRVTTTEDQLPETNEVFELSLSQTSNLTQVTMPGQRVKFTIQDDDPGTKDLGEEGIIAIYTRNASGNYIISATAAQLPQPIPGLPGPSELLEDVSKHLDVINAMVKLIPSTGLERIDQLELIYSDGLYGYVYPPNTSNLAKWNMGLNAAIAHPDGVFDGNGEITYTIVHEYAHILTLNDTQLDVSVQGSDCKTIQLEGCPRTTSYMHPFYTNFWEGDVIDFFNRNNGQGVYDKYPTHFVTRYASSNIAEDIAEVFSTFVTQDDIPTSSDMSSTALKKLNSFMTYSEMTQLRNQMRATGLIKQVNNPVNGRGGSASGIRFSNRDTKTGKFVSCTRIHRH